MWRRSKAQQKLDKARTAADAAVDALREAQERWNTAQLDCTKAQQAYTEADSLLQRARQAEAAGLAPAAPEQISEEQQMVAQAALAAQYVAEVKGQFDGQEAVDLGSAVEMLSRYAAVGKMRIEAKATAAKEVLDLEAPGGDAPGGAPPAGGAGNGGDDMDCSELSAAIASLDETKSKQLAEFLTAQGISLPKRLRGGDGRAAPGAASDSAAAGAPAPGVASF
eukprot:2918247-Pyramimonas_sp.AAC.1